jgi:hypothetical protein
LTRNTSVLTGVISPLGKVGEKLACLEPELANYQGFQPLFSFIQAFDLRQHWFHVSYVIAPVPRPIKGLNSFFNR